MSDIYVPSNTGEPVAYGEAQEIMEEAAQGHPRRYMETFLKIEDQSSRIIPFLFMPNQDYFHSLTFELKDMLERGFWAYILKDRKAYSSTYIGGCVFTFTMNIPSFHSLIVGALAEHAEVPLKMVDTFYNNLPDTRNYNADGTPAEYIMRPEKTHWDQSYREVGFGDIVTENGKRSVDVKVKSSITIATSRNPDAGAGATFRCLWEIEKGRFDPVFEKPLMTTIMNSPPKNLIRFTDSTPHGTKNLHYSDFKKIKAGEVNAIYLARFWFQNSLNALDLDDSMVVPGDRREMLKTGTLVLTGEEERVAKLFPADGTAVPNRIMWRRAQIAKATRDAMDDPAYGRAMFLQEHMENDVDCWVNLTNPVFDVSMLRRMLDNAREPLPAAKLREAGLSPVPIPGMQFRAWELPYSGGRYYGGMDLGGTKKYNDASVLKIFDARTGRYVASMSGRKPLLESVRAGADIMRVYNVGLFGPEVNGIGAGALEGLIEYGYPNIYFREPKTAPRVDRVTPRDYGWYTGAANRPQMFGNFQEAIAKGQIDIPDKELIDSVMQWDPDPLSTEHVADDVMAAMIAYGMALEAGRFPTPNAVMPRFPLPGRQVQIEAPPAFSKWLR